MTRPSGLEGFRLGLLVCLALAGAACIPPETVGRIDGLDIEKVLQENDAWRSTIASRADRMLALAWKITGTLLVALAFYAGMKAMRGDADAWGAAKTYLKGVVLCAVLLDGWRVGGPGLFKWSWVYEAGIALADQIKPDNTLAFEALFAVGRRVAEIVGGVVNPANWINQPGLALHRWIESVVYLLESPWVALFMTVNSYAIFVMKLVWHVVFVSLVSYLWVWGPLFTPLVAHPKTRPYFGIFARAYVSIALLWPGAFATLELLVGVIPYATWIGTDVYTGNPVTGVIAIVQSQIMFMAINCSFFLLYLSIPPFSLLITFLAGRGFRV